jgi:hypothetical protein
MKPASKFEIVAARLWNVLNEGKSFHPVFVLGTFLLLHVGELLDAAFWTRALPALLAVAPLVLVFVRYDFPLKLRWALWAFLVAFVLLFRFVDLAALALALGLYVFFTVFFWGTLYYHLRTGAPKTNFIRFWRLVLENPDSTSGNFLEQVPKAMLVLFALEYLVAEPVSTGRVVAVLVFTLAVGVASYLVHRLFFDWKPVYPEEPTREVNVGEPLAKRVIVVVIDGCRLDRFREAEKPYLERMMARGTVYESVETAYPARTVVCFSSMFTGAAPERHGITSNLVLKLGLKVESIFDVLRRRGKVGKLVGIAHLIDAFGHEDVASVTSVAHNDKIDGNLVAAARRELEEHDPDLLVLQLLAVDQNGHVRGTYYPEYVERIEITDSLIEEFMGWCEERGYLDDAAVVLMADHGQGRGIGAHGHLSEGERFVPFAMWGKGIVEGRVVREPHFILDLAPTICYLLGVEPPAGSTGRVLTQALERNSP